tara:strand:- start:620 stop:808 length:189 start_codon:yes stop_codon:yes gene_type:complete
MDTNASPTPAHITDFIFMELVVRLTVTTEIHEFAVVTREFIPSSVPKISAFGNRLLGVAVTH